MQTQPGGKSHTGNGRAPLAAPVVTDEPSPADHLAAELEKIPATPVDLLAAAAERIAAEPPAPSPDQRLAELRAALEELRRRAVGATSWLETSEHYTRLLNSEGFVPVTARFDARDLLFLGRAREDLLRFAELGARLTDLHSPLDAGGTSSDPANPALRCRNCMWRWPCPSVRLLTEFLSTRPG
jgi:hypothetical protein